MVDSPYGLARQASTTILLSKALLFLCIINSVLQWQPCSACGTPEALFEYGLDKGDTEATDLSNSFAVLSGMSDSMPFYGLSPSSYTLLIYHSGSLSMIANSAVPCPTDQAAAMPFVKDDCETTIGILAAVSRISFVNMSPEDNGGRLFYRHGSMVTAAQKTAINSAIMADFGLASFSTTYAVFVTWVNVMDTIQSQQNTFQIALATDGAQTFAYFNYEKLGTLLEMSVGIQTAHPTSPPFVEHILNSMDIVQSCSAQPCVRWAWDITGNPPTMNAPLQTPCPCCMTQNPSTEPPSRCEFPLDVGTSGCPDTGSYKRFYFDGTECNSFFWLGCGGNENRFKDRQECKMHCTPEVFGEPNIPEGIPDSCLETKDSGLCTDTNNMKNYFYNQFLETCRSFVYTGCGGNGNRFTRRQDCLAACVNFPPPTTPTTPPTETTTTTTPTPSRCDHDLAIGTDTCGDGGMYERYYFDTTDEVCRQFTWLGCDGNENRFFSSYECRMHCSPTFRDPMPQDPSIPPECLELRDSGLCVGSISAFFYNKFTNKCRPFTYTGCEGNNNRFDTRQECLNTCINLA